jgi:thiazole synthase
MQSKKPAALDDPLVIAGVEYASRLLVGTGKYKDMDETREATLASGAEIVTVAIRRTNIGQNKDEPNLLDVISPDQYTLLPNTKYCRLLYRGGRRTHLPAGPRTAQWP